MNRIRELRKAKGLTMKELGARFGLAESTVSLYERGKHEPDLETLRNLSAFFSVTVDYLLGHESPDQIEKAPTPDDARAEAKMLLENMTDDEYERALAMLKLLNGRK